jgi:hypothetical protein
LLAGRRKKLNGLSRRESPLQQSALGRVPFAEREHFSRRLSEGSQFLLEAGRSEKWPPANPNLKQKRSRVLIEILIAAFSRKTGRPESEPLLSFICQRLLARNLRKNGWKSVAEKLNKVPRIFCAKIAKKTTEKVSRRNLFLREYSVKNG